MRENKHILSRKNVSSRYSSILVDPYFHDRAGDPTERMQRITVAEPHRNHTCFSGHLSL